jgi:integrase
MRGQGRVFTRGGRWWIAYYAPKNGKSVERREPAVVEDHGRVRPAKTETEAKRHLRRRRDEVGAHRTGAQPFKGPQQERIEFSALLDALVADYRTKGLASLGSLESRLKHVRDYFNSYKALAVTADDVRRYIANRRGHGAAEATIQRELEAIRRAFTLAAEDGRLAFTPVIPTLSIGQTNARQGFLSRADFQALLDSFEESDLRDFVEWAWWSGARKGESAKLRWEYLDRDTWTITIPASITKTKQPRTLELEADRPLRAVIERRIAARRLDCPFIFHRAGEPIREFRQAWATACRKANLPGVLFHDLRRSAIRNMIRGGTDYAVAMKISGHRTRSVFDRYNITSPEDIKAAISRTADYVSSLPTERKVAAITDTK